MPSHLSPAQEVAGKTSEEIPATLPKALDWSTPAAKSIADSLAAWRFLRGGSVKLRLDEGTVVGELRPSPQGIRHRMVFGVEEASGRQVAAKIELIAGALGRERRALRWLNEKEGLAPRLLASGTVVEGDAHTGALCVVTARVTGGPPTSNEGWERMGQVIARLADVPVRSSDLPTLGHGDFLALHGQRVDELSEALGRDLGAGLPAVPPAYLDSPLVLTHGDPGPGNFLDDGVEGTLVDWEDAQVAPRGLDLGRAIFMALLGSPLGRRASVRASGGGRRGPDGLPRRGRGLLARRGRAGLVARRRRSAVRAMATRTRGATWSSALVRRRHRPRGRSARRPGSGGEDAAGRPGRRGRLAEVTLRRDLRPGT
jgi:Phosphotransferase enzyme family